MSERISSDRKFWLWLLGTTALSIFLLAQVVPSLDYYSILSEDEGQILSDARTLSAHGRLGSDLYQGAWNTSNNLFISPPIQRILIATAFRIAGESITSARAVTVISALVVLWSISIFAKRQYGWAAALAAAFLLVTWRSYLGGDSLGLPLLTAARSARYDLTCVAFIWLSILTLSVYLTSPSALKGILIGLSAGLAALTQFFGVFAVVLIVLVLAVSQGKAMLRVRSNAWIAVGLSVILVPYALSVLLDWPNFVTQTFVMKQARTAFLDPLFYFQNILTEWWRFHPFLLRAFLGDSGRLAQVTALAALLALLGGCLNLVARWRTKPAPGERILPLSLVVFAAGLLLFDSTKSPIYSILLYPSLCLVLAVLAQDIWFGLRGRSMKLAGAVASLLIVALLLAQSLDAIRQDRVSAAAASRYNETASQILAQLPQEARVLTSARLAWGLRALSPDTTIYLALQWQLAHRSNQTPALLPGLLERKTQYLVLDDAAFVDAVSDAQLDAQLRTIMIYCAERQYHRRGTSYGTIHIYRLTPNATNCPHSL